MSKVNLSSVNISIQEFQRISKGEYNAGEIKLKSGTTLDKVSNHVHQTWFNKTSISHEEILAIKNAFIQALSSNGVGSDALNAVRRELGLAVDDTAPTSLHERSLKPLTRQQVREILDRNEAAINAHAGAGTIRTAAQLNAGRSERRLAKLAEGRRNVNDSLGANHDIEAHQGIADAEAVIAGDIDHATDETKPALLAHARQMLKQTLEKCGGKPRADEPADIGFHMPTKQYITIGTGKSETEFVRHLEETILRLEAKETGPNGEPPPMSQKLLSDCILAALRGEQTENLPHGFRNLFADMRKNVLGRFGSGLLRSKQTIADVLNESTHEERSELVRPGGHERAQLTPETLRADLERECIRCAAQKVFTEIIGKEFLAAGGYESDCLKCINRLKNVHPEMMERLNACQNLADVENLAKTFHKEIADSAKIVLALTRTSTKALLLYKEKFAKVAGLPISTIVGDAISLSKIDDKFTTLTGKIITGEIAVRDEAEIEAKLNEIADKWVAQYEKAFRELDSLHLPKPVHDALRDHILGSLRVDQLELGKIVGETQKQMAEAIAELDDALVPGADKNAVFNAMRKTGLIQSKILSSVYAPGTIKGGDEIFVHGGAVMLAAVYSRPGLVDKIKEFMARDDVRSEPTYRPDHPAGNYRMLLDMFSHIENSPFSRPVPDAAARPAADTARMEALVAKYEGGLSEGDKMRLREFANGLDYSENAVAQTEKDIAEYLDQLCGGGDFANPASSVSRRAIAAGARPEDLPLLNHFANALDKRQLGFGKGICNMVADPNSNFRKACDAAISRLDKNDIEAKETVAMAIGECRDDADLIDIITQGIDRVVLSGAGKLRSENELCDKIASVKATLDELREITKDDPALFAAGKRLLCRLQARRVPAGYMGKIVADMRSVDITAMEKLTLGRGRKPASSMADVHAALMQLQGHVERIIAETPNEKLITGGDEIYACKNFLIDVAVLRLTAEKQQAVRELLNSGDGRQLLAFYSEIGDDNIELDAGTSIGVQNMFNRVGGQTGTLMQSLFSSLGSALNVEDPGAGIPTLKSAEKDYGRIPTQTIYRDVMRIARENITRTCRQYLAELVSGKSPAANAMRNIYANFIGPENDDPSVALNQAISTQMTRLLDSAALAEAKRLLAGQLDGTQFAAARAAGIEVTLPNGEKLSNDPSSARDQIAQFVTGRGDAQFASLSAEERNKAVVVMAMLTQQSAATGIVGRAIALDPAGAKPTYVLQGGETNTAFRLARNEHGAIDIECKAVRLPETMVVGDKEITLGQGSEFIGDFSISLDSNNIPQIENLNLATANNIPFNILPETSIKVS